MVPRSLDNAAVTSIPPELSCWSILWALAAVVTHCMLQPSFNSYFWNSTAFEGSLSPHRSSPFICLADSAVDIYLLFRPRSDASSIEHKSSKHGVLTRLALYLLGVLPQSLKILSARGIPITQAIVAAFLLSSTVSLVCSLMLDSHDERLRDFASNLKGPEEPVLGLFSPKARASLLGLIVFVGHVIGIIMVFHHHKDLIGFDAPQDVQNAFQWIVDTGSIVYLAYTLQNTAFIVVGKRSPIPPLPALQLLVCTNHLCFNDLLRSSGRARAKQQQSSDRVPGTITVTATLTIVCYLVAWALQSVGQAVHARCSSGRRSNESDNSIELSPTAPVAAERGPSAAADTTSEAVTEQADLVAPEEVERDVPVSELTPSQMFFRVVFWISKWILILAWRLFKGIGGPFIYMFNWIELHVKKHHPLRGPMMTFGLVNFATAAIYYLAFFDPHGTKAPAWSQALG
ncbi:uncharacterized protein AB675_465 [Cyphellophora attinorum]|uniref:Uncharacterized protein n=1 Tax=Cyphellophora attinorum TaxID=1664694 RepID=A0A0N1P210_9EURO|nr:uncharacterized protein AB675_465 [Phialophora attinorum]KPI46094.1 hypothetical protein AB675_465 [Phialophora attinorum]